MMSGLSFLALFGLLYIEEKNTNTYHNTHSYVGRRKMDYSEVERGEAA